MFNFFKKTVKTIKNVFRKSEDEVKLELMEMGFPFDLAEKMVEEYKEGKSIEEIIKENVADESKKINELLNPKEKPYVILVIGNNGSGKTTFIYKLAWFLKSKGKKVLISASDTFRAAAIEQLENLAKKINVPIVKGEYGKDPVAVAFDALKKAKEEDFDYLIIDTAGRLHSRSDLLMQLEKMKRKIKPNLTLLVIDATIGQDIVDLIEEYKDLFDEIVVNKVDIENKSSAFFVAKYFDKPIVFLGIGQDKEDLVIYRKEELIKELFENKD
ncbi:MAG: GTP-binding protein [Nanoarchaeota archaeon]